MRYKITSHSFTLFPFLSVLVSTMGVLAFLSISFLLLFPQVNNSNTSVEKIQFEWTGAPKYVKPIFFKCTGDYIQYYNLFENKDYTISLKNLLDQLQGEDSKLISYLIQILQLNNSIKQQFGNTEYYPLLLVYPDGILASEILMVMIEKIGKMNFGLEPFLPHWEVPYQSLIIRE